MIEIVFVLIIITSHTDPITRRVNVNTFAPEVFRNKKDCEKLRLQRIQGLEGFYDRVYSKCEMKGIRNL